MAETPVSADAFVRVVLRSLGGREGVKGLFEARVDGGLRVPVEGTSGQARVYAASELLARLGRSVLRWKVFGGVFEGQYVCAGNVFDIDVVAGLFPAAVYRRGLTTGQVAAEDRHDPCFSVWVLPGPVDVGVAECDVWQAELDVVVVQVSLARELGDTVGGDGVLRVVLGGGQYLLLTVHCSARGGEDHLLHTVLGTVL